MGFIDEGGTTLLPTDGRHTGLGGDRADGFRRMIRGRGIRLAIVLAMFVVPLFATSTASAARSEFYGITQGSLDDQDVQGMAAARVHIARFMLRWRSIEPTKGSFKWGEEDTFVGRLASHGIRAFPFVWGSPSWVGGGAAAQPPIASAADQQAWRDFLQRAVARYGPGGTYWGAPYHQAFGASAKAVPIQSWQIWNEPNLKKYFTPGQNVNQSAHRYATLLRIAHDAIKAKDPNAQIVLAGMPGFGDSKAWVFLDYIYGVAGGIKSDFDAAALHPYACSVDEVGQVMSQFHSSMTNHGDGATPLLVTEFAWGSGPPDSFCKNRGLAGQSDLLQRSYQLFLSHRHEWNLQALYWFLWRDPAPGSYYAHLCSICGTAGLLRYNRTAKPAYTAFRHFTVDATAPTVRITSGPTQGSFTNDPTPTFGFTSSQVGSTFQCHVDTQAVFGCWSPYTRVNQLADGTHTFYVESIDPSGNESTVLARGFTVDTVAPQTTITGGPGTTTNPRPTFTFTSSQANSTFQCRFDVEPFRACSGPGSSDTPSSPLAGGLHNFYVRAIDRAKNVDLTPVKRSFTVS